MSDSFEYYGLGPFLASRSEKIRGLVKDACAIHDSRTFSNIRMDGKPVTLDDRFTPIGLQIWWRSHLLTGDPRELQWFQWMTCFRASAETHASLQTRFRSACAALPEAPEFKSLNARGLAGLTDTRLPKVPRPAFLGAFELCTDHAGEEPLFLILSWHPKLAWELLVSIAQRSLPPHAQ